MTYVLRPEELAGFDVYGERQDDGSITLGSCGTKVNVPAFPQEVTIPGYGTYTLEGVRENSEGMDPQRFPPDHKGWRICWGIYV